MIKCDEIVKDVIALREQWKKRDDWDCFWSSPTNSRGLQLTPQIELGRVFLDLEIEKEHSGNPGICNGGVTFTILDGMMSWFLISHLGRSGFTLGSTIKYFAPLHVGKKYRFLVRAAEKGSRTEQKFDLEGVVFSFNGDQVVTDRPFVHMTAPFILPNREMARKVLQVDLGPEGEELFPN